MSSNVRNFNGKVVLITGSSDGIGAVTAVEFFRSGAYVVITGRNLDKLSEVEKVCEKVSPNGLKPLVVVADVSQVEDCERLVDKTIGKYGKLDILVNNAGIGTRGPIDDPDILEKYEKIMDTNVRSVVYLCHLCVKHLENTKGNIVNISSVTGLRPFRESFLYCMSKSAIDLFTKCLAVDLGPKGIRVNVVNPGPVRTNFMVARGISREKADEIYQQIGPNYPLGRVGEPIDIANAILFLASNESSFVTGINFVSDGGAIFSAH
ncbi:uncharacterized oxidoreductase TM_0325-like [Oppia nitens]|uniref:uncharacterized oxidoreductase TM_0325-like n=1 Tax=Oppia nitens TaxID=1686743 RepID=UPI0023D99287|nr:uncharacterized oxidoreductase TM_0325-like [Oppia nitens]